MALGIGRSLKDSKVKVFNSGTKEKLAADFMKFKKQNKSTPIIALFDSDAKKEFDELVRVTAGKKNLYRIFSTGRGTYEDIFDPNVAIDALNTLYPEGERIIATDFDLNKEFLICVRDILSRKKKATLDKVKFAKLAAVMSVKNRKVPQLIVDIVDLAEKFAKQSART
jgi:hypothetical protein